MSMITGTLKSLIVIKLKGRHDSFTDQFNRIFMVKMCMVSAFLLGMNWFKDTINCIVPGTAGIDKGYVKEACWIQGFYVFKELKRIPGVFGYYGIPRELNRDGLDPSGNLCTVGVGKDCVAMTKTFYLQYQWFPFYIAVIGFLYYSPYIVFRFVNIDLMTLKTSIKAPEVDINGLVKNYFNYEVNPPMRMRLRLLGNIGIKVLYLLVNVIAFTATDSLINGDFRNYGNEWIGWSKGTNQEAYDYTSNRGRYKPGEVLLPTFGFCEVLELGKDIKFTLYNSHRFVCEISQNVLYQYVLILLWFLFVIGMVISAVGFILRFVDQVLAMNCALPSGSQARRLYQTLTYREIEYLEFVRKKKLIVFGQLVRKLADERLGQYPGDDYSTGTDKNNPYSTSQKLLEEATQNL